MYIYMNMYMYRYTHILYVWIPKFYPRAMSIAACIARAELKNVWVLLADPAVFVARVKLAQRTRAML